MQHDADPPPATNLQWTTIPVGGIITYGEGSIKLSTAFRSLTVGVTTATAPPSGTAYGSLVIRGGTVGTGGESDKSFIITPRLVGDAIKFHITEQSVGDANHTSPTYYKCLVKKT